MRLGRGRSRELPATISLSPAGPLVRVRENARARRLTLRVGRVGEVTVTVPCGLSEPEIRDFLDRQSGWLDSALARLPEPVAVGEGARLPVDGRMVTLIRTSGEAGRLDGGRLVIGPRGAAGAAAERVLRAHALARLVPEAERAAAAFGRSVRSLTLRDTRSRWGSCSAAGRLSFSWRIAMAPVEVQRYLAVHEAAHLAEMNHSRRFWALVAREMPDYARPRAWLRRLGAELHRYRFDAG